MAYIFDGFGTGDDINWTAGQSFGASARASLVCGWWRPVATFTGGLWSVGNIFGARVDLGTDEIRLFTNNATTDGQWTTTGVDFVDGGWKFLAFMSATLNSGAAASWRVWAGDINTAPVAVTVSVATSPSGNFTGSSSFTLGNVGTSATGAWLGNIGSGGYIVTAAAVGVDNPFSLAAYSAITAEEEELVYKRFVLPMWQGDGWWNIGPMPLKATTDIAVWDLDVELPQVRRLSWATSVVGSGVTPTLNSVTRSEFGTPRPVIGRGIHPVPSFGM